MPPRRIDRHRVQLTEAAAADMAAWILGELVIDGAGTEADLKSAAAENAAAFDWLGAQAPQTVERLRDRYRTRRAALRQAEAGEPD